MMTSMPALRASEIVCAVPRDESLSNATTRSGARGEHRLVAHVTGLASVALPVRRVLDDLETKPQRRRAR